MSWPERSQLDRFISQPSSSRSSFTSLYPNRPFCENSCRIGMSPRTTRRAAASFARSIPASASIASRISWCHGWTLPSGQLARKQGGSARRRRVAARMRKSCIVTAVRKNWLAVAVEKRREATLLELERVNASRATL